jgi:hypothetical protein
MTHMAVLYIAAVMNLDLCMRKSAPAHNLREKESAASLRAHIIFLKGAVYLEFTYLRLNASRDRAYYVSAQKVEGAASKLYVDLPGN